MALALQITIALAAGSILLALVSDAFAHEMSRLVEAGFDWIEYRLALRERKRERRKSPRVEVVRADVHVLRSGAHLVTSMGQRKAA